MLFLLHSVWSCGFFLSLDSSCGGSHWFSNIEPTLHPWDKPHLVYSSFYILMNSIWYYFIKSFCVYVHKGLPSFLPFVLFFTVFGFDMRVVILTSQNELNSISSSSIFQKRWYIIGFNSFLKDFVEFSTETIWS